MSNGIEKYLNTIIHGDCLEVMRQWKENCVDAVITDPPYGLEFMGKEWDHGVPGAPFWTEALRIAKPGCHLLAFGGTRTHHRLMCAIEDAGWEIRDTLMWLYGSGFPKSHDISKAIDKAVGAHFISKPASGVGFMTPEGRGGYNITKNQLTLAEKPTDFARQWSGWGTALKPAWEPIVLARKPIEGTVADNVLKYGCGGLNIDESKIGTEPVQINELEQWSGFGQKKRPAYKPKQSHGRWPANLILDDTIDGEWTRFFYCAKASKAERNAGLVINGNTVNDGRNAPIDNPYQRGETMRQNTHPTVKPLALMRYLCKLIAPPSGVVLDPMCGSGSTCIASVQLGFDYIGIEKEKEHVETARARIAQAESGVPAAELKAGQQPLFGDQA